MSAAHELLKEFVASAPSYESVSTHREYCSYCNVLIGDKHRDDCLVVRASIEIAKSEGWVPLSELLVTLKVDMPSSALPTKTDGDTPQRVVWVNSVSKGVAGYAMHDCNGELSEPVRTCSGCQHFGIHDWHYYYCSAQYNENNQSPGTSYVYPWRGAGKQMRRSNAENCPVGERPAAGSSPPMPDDPTPEEERAAEDRAKAHEIQLRLKRNLEKRKKK